MPSTTPCGGLFPALAPRVTQREAEFCSGCGTIRRASAGGRRGRAFTAGRRWLWCGLRVTRVNGNRPMAGSIEARLKEKGVTLPNVAAPAANYVPSVISGNILYISGQVPFVDGKISHTGKLGAEFKVEDGYACARI